MIVHPRIHATARGLNGPLETETVASGGSENLSGRIERVSGDLEEGGGPGAGLAASWVEAAWNSYPPVLGFNLNKMVRGLAEWQEMVLFG
jgi:hypothetical protein